MNTILIVDAPEGDASVLASALRVEGFRVVLTSSLPDARKALVGGSVSMVILDLMLRGDAGTTGLEFAREVRVGHPGVRVLLTSSYHLSERQLERADCGVSGFIPKPYDVGEVVDFVHSKLEGPPSSRRLWHAEPGSGVTSSLPPRPLAEAVGVSGRR